MLPRQVSFWSALAAAWLAVGVLYGADACTGGSCSGGSCSGSCSQATTGCGQSCGGCSSQTVLVPQWVTETHKIMTTECVPETRQRKCIVTRCVAETANVEREYTVMVPQVKTCTETYMVQVPTTRNVTEEYQVCVPTYRDVQRSYTVCVPVWKQEQRQCTVMVPYTETRQATRQVCQCIPVSETQTVCRDRGHWEQQAASTCGCGSTCGDSCCGSTCGSGLWTALRLRVVLLLDGLGPQSGPGAMPGDRNEAADCRTAVPVLRHALQAGNPHHDGQCLQL